jgi:hypothetical protein
MIVDSVRIYCFDEPIFFFEKRIDYDKPSWYFRNDIVTNKEEIALLKAVASGNNPFNHIIFRNRSYEGLTISVTFNDN